MFGDIQETVSRESLYWTVMELGAFLSKGLSARAFSEVVKINQNYVFIMDGVKISKSSNSTHSKSSLLKVISGCQCE